MSSLFTYLTLKYNLLFYKTNSAIFIIDIFRLKGEKKITEINETHVPLVLTKLQKNLLYKCRIFMPYYFSFTSDISKKSDSRLSGLGCTLIIDKSFRQDNYFYIIILYIQGYCELIGETPQM